VIQGGYVLAGAPSAPIAVCVPVRNEVDALPALLAALARQDIPEYQRCIICFYFDCCSDGSESLVGQARSAFPHEIYIASGTMSSPSGVGRARRLAVELALHVLGDRLDSIIVSTDADTVPSGSWLSANVAGLAYADIVAGRIEQSADRRSASHVRIAAFFDDLHRLSRVIDPVAWEASATHHYSGGASLCFTAQTYSALGGFGDLERGEDAAFVAAAGWMGYRVRRDANVVVETSARRSGRVANGFAGHLQALDDAGGADAFEVVDPREALLHFRRQAHARRCYRSGTRAALLDLADALGLDPRAIQSLKDESGNDEAFCHRALTGVEHTSTMSLAQAEPILKRLLQIYAIDPEPTPMRLAMPGPLG
jgi:Glycosyl transferase family 2